MLAWCLAMTSTGRKKIVTRNAGERSGTVSIAKMGMTAEAMMEASET